jgi:chaperonin GroES
MKLHPTGNRIIVKPDDQSQTASGLLISRSHEKPEKGTIVSVGGASIWKPDVHVLFSKYAGTEIETDEGKLILIRDDDVMAVIEDD